MADMKTPDATLVFKLLAALGGLAILALIALPFFFLRVILQTVPSAPTPPAETVSELGNLGAKCGGPALLPCKPGLICSSDPNVKESEGVCVTQAQASPSFQEISEPCGDTRGYCDAGLYCKKVATGSICATIDATAPHVASVNITGATFENSIYRLPLNAAGNVVIQTANASGITLNLEPNEGYGTAGVSLWVTQPKRGTGGVYTSTLTLRHDFEGKLTMVVASKSGDTSYLSVNVASAK